MDPEAELAEVERKIAALRELLEPLQAERRRIKAILAGPRVHPVSRHCGGQEEEHDDIDAAFGAWQGTLDSGYPVPVVTVGGSEMSFDEWDDANPGKAWLWR